MSIIEGLCSQRHTDRVHNLLLLIVSGVRSRVLLLVIFLVDAIMSMRNEDRVPWSDQLRQIHAGVSHKAEWMAPDSVVNQVRADYLRALGWQHDSLLKSLSHQWREAPQYLSGLYLKRHRAVLHHQRQSQNPLGVGVLRARSSH